MKGIIFNILENFIAEKYNSETYEQILSECNLQTKDPFVGPGTYPDADFMEIVGKSTAKLNLSQETFFREFGKYTFKKLAEAFPAFVEKYDNPKEFLKTVEGIIHVEVNKLYEGAETPKFTYAEPAENKLIITYQSKRKLYDFMAGLIDGVGDYFKTPIIQSHKKYEKNGMELCDFDLTFQNKTDHAAGAK